MARLDVDVIERIELRPKHVGLEGERVDHALLPLRGARLAQHVVEPEGDVARRLIEVKRPGRIVNISSTGAYHYMGQGAALYSITKAGISRMTEVLAVEWSRFHINVNGIAPGAFASEMMDGMLERMGDITRHFPRKRLGQPEQLDGTLLYLVSPSSECVTGTIIKVDDGQGPR